MKCPSCAEEIVDDSRFCPHCGRRVHTKEGFGKGIYLMITAVGAVLTAIVILFVLIMIRKPDAALQEAASENVQGETSEAESEKNNGANSDVENANGAEGVDTVESTEQAEDTQTEVAELPDLLVAAPTDYLPLRISPGYGDDVITELYAGRYLLWDGEMVTKDGHDFYKVRVEDNGETGYAAADYCIPVDYRYDEALLSIVDVSDALYTYDEMVEDIERLCSDYTECLSYETIGLSVDGRELYEVTLGAPDAPHHIFVQAAIHGREYMTAQLVMRMLEYYAANYECGSYQGDLYRDLFQNTAIHVVPMANPDGVTISQLGVDAMNHMEIGQLVYDCYMRDCGNLVLEEDLNGDMNWADYYKQPDYDREAEGKTQIITFEEYQRIWKSNASGVDLNNNFDAGWAEIDLKQAPSYGNYKGGYAVSEPETQALVELATRREYDCFISYHSKGQLIYYDVNGNDEQTSERSYGLASTLEKLLKYEPVNTQRGYNVNLGGFSDWVQLGLHKPSVTIESGKHPCPLAISEFDAIWFRHRESWAMLCEMLF